MTAVGVGPLSMYTGRLVELVEDGRFRVQAYVELPLLIRAGGGRTHRTVRPQIYSLPR